MNLYETTDRHNINNIKINNCIYSCNYREHASARFAILRYSSAPLVISIMCYIYYWYLCVHYTSYDSADKFKGVEGEGRGKTGKCRDGGRGRRKGKEVREGGEEGEGEVERGWRRREK